MKFILSPFRPALTLVEVILVLVIVALVTMVGIRQLALWMDRIAVRNAVADAAQLLARARDEAIARRAIVGVRVDTHAETVTLRARGQAIVSVSLGQLHGVQLSSTRDSVAFDARGLGYGAANLTLVARRGGVADTLVMSRLGRVQR